MVKKPESASSTEISNKLGDPHLFWGLNVIPLLVVNIVVVVNMVVTR